MTLHLFNPSHDEALASNHATYCPSKAARTMAAALAHLPRYWAAEGDLVVELPATQAVDHLAPLPWDDIARIEPWGWDRQVVALLRRMGAPGRLLPTPEQLDRWRALSSRHTTVQLLEWLNAQPLPAGVLRGESRWCTTLAEVEAALGAWPQVMVKLPWSCSGRGVFPYGGALDRLTRLRVEKAFREQGAVEIQQRHERLADWALEFDVAPTGEVRYLGPGGFVTGDGGKYLGQRVGTCDQLESALIAEWHSACSTLLPTASDVRASLRHLITLLTDGLARLIASHYVGPLGVDLLLTPAGLHPCLEINLRRTMGHVALAIAACHSDATRPHAFQLSPRGLEFVTS